VRGKNHEENEETMIQRFHESGSIFKRTLLSGEY
jgi:hypothetical protein